MENVDITSCLVMLIQSNEYDIFKASLRAVGNILTGKNIHCETFMKHGLVDSLVIAWNNFGQTVDLQKEFCWIVSNIAANPSDSTMM